MTDHNVTEKDRVDPAVLASMTPEGRDLLRRVLASTPLHITIEETRRG